MRSIIQYLLDEAEPEELAHRWQCDLADDTLHWTNGVYDLFGIPRGEAVDRDAVVAMYLPESRAELERLRGAAIAGLGSFTFEARIRRRDGALRWIRISADVTSSDGRATQLHGLKQDVTAQMRGRRAPSIRPSDGCAARLAIIENPT